MLGRRKRLRWQFTLVLLAPVCSDTVNTGNPGRGKCEGRKTFIFLVLQLFLRGGMHLANKRSTHHWHFARIAIFLSLKALNDYSIQSSIFESGQFPENFFGYCGKNVATAFASDVFVMQRDRPHGGLLCKSSHCCQEREEVIDKAPFCKWEFRYRL